MTDYYVVICPACERGWPIFDNQFLHVTPSPDFQLCLCLKGHHSLTTEEIDRAIKFIESFPK